MATAPLQTLERGRARAVRPVSWPGGAGRPGYRAGPPRPNYAQAPAGRAGRDPAERRGGHIPTPGRRSAFRMPAFRMAGGRPLRRTLELRHRPRRARRRRRFGLLRRAGRGRPRPAAASATCGASRGDRRQARRAAPGSRSAPAAAVRRCAACAACARVRSGGGGMKVAGVGSSACGGFAGRLEQRRLHRHRPDRDLLDRGRRQDGGGDRGMGGRFHRRGAGAWPAARRALDPVGDAARCRCAACRRAP